MATKKTTTTTTKTAAAAEAPVTLLRRPERRTAEIEIIGTAPLIAHRWSEKARAMMLDKFQGRKTPKEIKDPQAEYEAARYRFDDGRDGFPMLAFKAATIEGGQRVFGKRVVVKTEMRQALSFLPDGMCADGTFLTAITYDELVMREDTVRLNGTGADLRYRPEYRGWKAVLRVAYFPHLIDFDSLVALVDAGGTNGVGEWRPEKDGIYGTYEVATS